MMDVLTPEQRHRNMSAIRGKDTRPEELVRKYLFSHGFRYRKNDRRYPGKPDIVLPRYRTVVFVHGCFWHQHAGCRYATIPKSHQEFWIQKLQKNVIRDQEAEQQLINMGWQVITVWECQIRRKSDREETLRSLVAKIRRTTDV